MSQVVRQVIVYVLYFLIVVVIVGAIVIALTSNDETEAPAPKENGESSQKAEGAADTLPSTSGGSQLTTQSSSQAGSTVATNTTSTAQASSTELSESGPGETIAIFAAGTLVGYVLYRRRLVKQSS